jgi:ATP-dependent Lon protease
MKESAQAALSYVRAHADEYGLEEQDFSSFDLHVHVPEGATPKDGPSAGVTMATAIVSALTGREVRGDVAMTGEITLRGKVLAIGGLKEKALAARRVGITTVIIPKDNEKDLEEMPDVLKRDVCFVPVSEIKEVLEIALGESRQEKKQEGEKAVPIMQNRSNRTSVRCKE